MIISTKKGAPQAELDRIIDNFEHQGLPRRTCWPTPGSRM